MIHIHTYMYYIGLLKKELKDALVLVYLVLEILSHFS